MPWMKTLVPTNCCFILFDSHCEFQDPISGMMIGRARMVDGPYYSDNNFFNNKQAQGYSGSISSISVHEQIMLWHLKLGHPSFPYLKHLFPTLFKNLDCSFLQCESCHLSNIHQVSYISKPYWALKTFYFVHSDIEGP